MEIMPYILIALGIAAFYYLIKVAVRNAVLEAHEKLEMRRKAAETEWEDENP